ncbi:MAG: hypothetical protein ACI8PB_004978 [Desulforhopalus sp.]|jgi:hypothetical protein
MALPFLALTLYETTGISSPSKDLFGFEDEDEAEAFVAWHRR